MNQRFSTTLFVATLALSSASIGACLASPVLIDSSFEDPALPNTAFGNGNNFLYQPTGTAWTYSSHAGVSANGGPFYSGAAPDGVQAAFLQSGTSSGVATISQTVTNLVVGQVYAIAFYLATRPGYGVNPVNVTVGGTDLGTFTNTTTSFIRELTVGFKAVSTSILLSFNGQNISSGDNDAAIDAVSVVEVPEPASLALLGAGLLAGGLVRRGRRRTA